MPAVETIGRTDTVVLWMRSGTDGYGEPKVDAPVEIDVRLEWKYREMLRDDGTKVALVAEAILDREIAIDSILWPGTMAEWLSRQPNQSGLLQIVTQGHVEDVKGRNVRRTAGLMRFRDALPEVG